MSLFRRELLNVDKGTGNRDQMNGRQDGNHGDEHNGSLTVIPEIRSAEKKRLPLRGCTERDAGDDSATPVKKGTDQEQGNQKSQAQVNGAYFFLLASLHLI